VRREEKGRKEGEERKRRREILIEPLAHGVPLSRYGGPEDLSASYISI